MLTISVVVETFIVTREYPGIPRAQSPLRATLDRLTEQTYPKDQTEVIVVFDQTENVFYDLMDAQYPAMKFVLLKNADYFSMKNHGIHLAGGEIVALLDGDCIPTKDWLERIAATFSRGTDGVVGKTLYRPDHFLSRTFSVFDFGHVQADRNGEATGILASNVAFKKGIAQKHPFDGRGGRNGGCYFLACQLKALGYKISYDPSQFVEHTYDIKGLGFIHKHLRRGIDSINYFRLDDRKLMNETRWMKLGAVAPLIITVNRVLFDFGRILSYRRHLGIPVYTIPYFYLMSMVIRGIEFIGEMIALIKNPSDTVGIGAKV